MKSRELAHIWAQQSKERGKCGNVFFEGKSIYSYGYHFKMAEFVAAPNGQIVVLINPDKYSVSTSKHQSEVARSIPHNIESFECASNEYREWDYEREVKRRIGIIQELQTKTARARKNIDWNLQELKNAVAQLGRFSELFQVELPPIAQLWVNDVESIVSPEKLAEIKEKEKIRNQKELEKRKEDIQKWLTGEKESISNLPEIFLRRVNGHVETTLGAVVEVKEAKALYSMIKKGKPVHGFSIGYYRVNGYANGVLTVGCHKLKDKEINRFAQSQNW